MSSKRQEIDTIVKSKVVQVRGRGHSISGKQLKIWGIQAAKYIGSKRRTTGCSTFVDAIEYPPEHSHERVLAHHKDKAARSNS